MRIKKTISCADVTYSKIDHSINETYIPKMGDVALFEVLEIGKHTTVQNSSKRNATILEGDFILAAFANRYATAQFEGYIPTEPTQILDILGAGGAIGIVKTKNAAFEHIEPTKLKLVGYEWLQSITFNIMTYEFSYYLNLYGVWFTRTGCVFWIELFLGKNRVN
jgi:hypothetical protein